MISIEVVTICDHLFIDSMNLVNSHGAAMQKHVLAKAELMGKYDRKR